MTFGTQDELAEEKGPPWAGGPWTEDMRGTEMPGISAFLQVDGEVFHMYSMYGRGIEESTFTTAGVPRPAASSSRKYP
ncbi:DUF899 family protein [Micromonospora sp. NPDC000668]|uniref:DUF899 family protein n=2 Tax=unclassified Micromonospora TaxID=2617518 RepID=UPI0036D0B29B